MKASRKMCWILIISLFLAAIPFPVLANEGISTDTAYKGLGITLLLVWLSNNLEIKIHNTPSKIINSKNITQYSEEDIELLARTVNGEARGEVFEGQIAVAAVIINRLESEEFPNTIHEIVYQEKQFSSVLDGQINLNPIESAYRATLEAINGADPSKGALYFFNPKTAAKEPLKWLQTRPVTVRIGNHVFAK